MAFKTGSGYRIMAIGYPVPKMGNAANHYPQSVCVLSTVMNVVSHRDCIIYSVSFYATFMTLLVLTVLSLHHVTIHLGSVSV